MSVTRKVLTFTGFEDSLVDEKTRATRLITCVTKCNEYLDLTGQCGKCNCFVRIKTELKNEACPLKKW